jgi:hypothetical protein
LYQVEVTCGEDSGTALEVTPYAVVTELAQVLATKTPLSLTLTETPTLILSPTAPNRATAIPSAVPQERIAQRGSNRGEIVLGSYDLWLYDAEAGDILSIDVRADIPALSPNTIARVANGMDTIVYVYLSNGKLLASNDDIEEGLLTDSRIMSLSLPETGTYRIEVHAFKDESKGAYTLNIQ